jgi:hypothetical protein
MSLGSSLKLLTLDFSYCFFLLFYNAAAANMQQQTGF